MLAVHGLGGGAWFFTALGRRVAGDCRLLAIDLPGTGRSTAGRPPSIELWVADLRDLIERYVGEPAILLGHSMGTIIALHAAAAWPEWLRGLVFVGGLPEPLDRVKQRLTERIAEVTAHGMAGSGALVTANNFAAATIRNQPELTAMFERLFESQDLDAYVRCCRILIGASAHSAIGSVRGPCLSITGTEDQYAPPELVAGFVRRLPVRCREEILADCGHFPFLEQPDAFAGMVRSFVRDA